MERKTDFRGWLAALLVLCMLLSRGVLAEGLGPGFVCQVGEGNEALSIYVVELPMSGVKIGVSQLMLRDAQGNPRDGWSEAGEQVETTGGNGSGARRDYWVWHLTRADRLEMRILNYIGAGSSSVPVTTKGTLDDWGFDGECQWKKEVVLSGDS